MMKIAVTGALGYLGCRLIQLAAQESPDIQLVLMDDLSAGTVRGLDGLRPESYRFIREDVLKADLVPLFCGCDAVIHLAGIADPALSYSDPARVVRQNVDAALRAAEICAALKIPFLFPSTTSVYGDPAAVDENCPRERLSPQTPYAGFKLLVETGLEDLRHRQGLAFAVLRLATVFGAGEGLRCQTAVGKFCRQAFSGEPLTVWRGALDQRRPYLAVEDAARAMLFILRKKLWEGERYNVLSLNASIAEIVAVLRREIPLLQVSEIESPAMNSFSADISSRKIRDAGFIFSGELGQGVRETLAWLRRNAAPAVTGV